MGYLIFLDANTIIEVMQINLPGTLQNDGTAIDLRSNESARPMIAASTGPINPRNSVQPEADASVMLTRPNPDCAVCGRRGELLYDGLTDRLFGASGKWSLKRCPGMNCGLIWLDPIPLESEINRAYQTYYTHPRVAAKISHLRDLYYRANYRLKAIHLRARFGDRGERHSAAAIFTWLALGAYIPTRQ
jgi:hypothetical protein